jgi:hypothetical protein
VKYKAMADKRRRPLEFEEGDFVWVVLTKDRFPLGKYNKLAARKIGPIEIVKKINANAYQLKLPSHIKTSDVFNIKHLVPFIDDSSEEDANSRANSLQPCRSRCLGIYEEERERCRGGTTPEDDDTLLDQSCSRGPKAEFSGAVIDRRLTRKLLQNSSPMSRSY